MWQEKISAVEQKAWAAARPLVHIRITDRVRDPYIRTDKNLFGLTIKGKNIIEIREGSPADRAGLTTNHLLLEVNRISTENLSFEEIVELIKESTQGIEQILDLLVEDKVPSYQKDPLPRLVILETSDKNALLYDIISQNGKYLSQNDENQPLWHAGEDKKDRIIEINGKSVTNLTFSDITSILRNLCTQNGNIKLLVVDDIYDLFWRNQMNKSKTKF